MKPRDLPLALDRKLFAGLAMAVLLFVLAFLPKPGPQPRPDFTNVQYAEGRLFCTSYLVRDGSRFRIDDVAYENYGGGSCTRKAHGFHGPRVRASWVPLPGPENRRLLMTVMDLQTRHWVMRLSAADVERTMAASDDPYVGLRLLSVMMGAFMVVASLATAHARRSDALKGDAS